MRFNGKVILTSVNATRPHIAYPVLLMYNAMREPDFVVVARGAAQAANGHIRVYAWKETNTGWQKSQRAQDDPTIFNACMQMGVGDLHLTGCIGARVGTQVKELTLTRPQTVTH